MCLSSIDRSALKLKPVATRKHELDISIISNLNTTKASNIDRVIYKVGKRLIDAKAKHSAIVMMIGAHVIRSGVQNYLIDLMKRGYISCLAMNGGSMIHDFEFAMIGATTENVSYYIRKGQFGLWKETGILNDVINQAYRRNSKIGMGEAVGQAIAQGDFPYKNISLLAAGYKLNLPITVHVGIGYDIIHEHPNCEGAATGTLSYNDFLRLASTVHNLENGVVINFGSAVTAPEVFLKALSMARNLAHQKGKAIQHFSTLVCDLHHLPEDISKEPPKDNPAYYFRPWKTMLIRTVANGGESFYVRGKHTDTIPALWSAIDAIEKEAMKHRKSLSK